METRAQSTHFFWAAADGTVHSLIAEASRRGLTLYNGHNVGIILDDPDNQAFLDKQIRDAVRGGVVRLFPRPQDIRVTIANYAEIRSRNFSPNATVANVARWAAHVVAIGQWAHEDCSFRFGLQTSPVTVQPWDLRGNRRLERRQWPGWLAESLSATGADSWQKDAEEVLLTTFFAQHSLNLSPSLPLRYREFIECLLALCEILMKAALAKKEIACQGGPTC